MGFANYCPAVWAMMELLIAVNASTSPTRLLRKLLGYPCGGSFWPLWVQGAQYSL
jgi:hypothetical protein